MANVVEIKEFIFPSGKLYSRDSIIEMEEVSKTFIDIEKVIIIREISTGKGVSNQSRIADKKIIGAENSSIYKVTLLDGYSIITDDSGILLILERKDSLVEALDVASDILVRKTKFAGELIAKSNLLESNLKSIVDKDELAKATKLADEAQNKADDAQSLVDDAQSKYDEILKNGDGAKARIGDVPK